MKKIKIHTSIYRIVKHDSVGESFLIIVRLWERTCVTLVWTKYFSIGRSCVFQNGDFFAQSNNCNESALHPNRQNIAWEFFKVHLASTQKIWHARLNLFFHFQPLRTTTPNMQTIRLTYTHYWKYVRHAFCQNLTRTSMSMQHFFSHFWKSIPAFPLLKRNAYTTFLSFY